MTEETKKEYTKNGERPGAIETAYHELAKEAAKLFPDSLKKLVIEDCTTRHEQDNFFDSTQKAICAGYVEGAKESSKGR